VPTKKLNRSGSTHSPTTQSTASSVTSSCTSLTPSTRWRSGDAACGSGRTPRTFSILH
jgi:hypothetical protein